MYAVVIRGGMSAGGRRRHVYMYEGGRGMTSRCGAAPPQARRREARRVGYYYPDPDVTRTGAYVSLPRTFSRRFGFRLRLAFSRSLGAQLPT